MNLHSVPDPAAVDSDLALITAYLGRELTAAQMDAVHERLDTDPAFLAQARPVIEAWTLAASFRAGATRRAAVHAAGGGFRRDRGVRAMRGSHLLRIAAVIAVILLPVFAVAQVTVYVAAHPGAPGHALAAGIMRALGRDGGRGSPTPAAQTGTAQPMTAPADSSHAPALPPVHDLPVGRALTPVIARQGDTIVRRASAPVHAGVATVRRDVSIGVADGDDRYVLGSVADIAVGASGEIYVWDRSVPAIRMYDALGKFVRTIGRQGSGPGEYRAASALAIAKDGNLMLWDPGNARINLYTPAGAVAGSWPTRSGTTGLMFGRGLLTVDTAGVTYMNTMLVDRSPGKQASTRMGWIRFRPDGTIRDTLFPPPTPSSYGSLTARSATSMSDRGVPFAPGHYTALSPLGYLVTGSTARIALDLHPTRGSIISIRRDAPSAPVSARERDSARAEITEEMRKIVPNWSWNGPDIPRTKEAYSDMMVDGQGRIWITRAEGPQAPGDTVASHRGGVFFAEGRGGVPRAPGWVCPSNGSLLLEVYEPSGRYLGQVRLPERADPLVMRGDQIWAASCDDDGVPSVVRFRIDWR